MKIRVRALRLDEHFITVHTLREGRCVSSAVNAIGARSVILDPPPQDRSGGFEEKGLHQDVIVEVSR